MERCLKSILLNVENTKKIVKDDEINNVIPYLNTAHKLIHDKNGPGSDYLGWVDLPEKISEEELLKIEETSKWIRENVEVFISVGIGGSYLGAKSAIEFLSNPFINQNKKRDFPEIYFAGHNLSSDYLSSLLEVIEGKKIAINVISKSGTTTEPAIIFRILKEYLEKIYGKDKAKNYIFATTDKSKGALKKLADAEGYKQFVIPNDVGGRYSVLTPVGLLPIAVAGIDIRELLYGAKDMMEITSNPDLDKNSAYLYAVIRNLLYRKGFIIEILSTFHPSLRSISEWWKQLAGESEGKNLGGIFPASAEFTTDLHSLGQWIQDGKRIIFETFLNVNQSNKEILIPKFEDDIDELNYISGKSLEYVNEKAYLGTASAHLEGGVPNMTITIPKRTPYFLGQLFYFFEKAIGISGYLSFVNPFDQPGVEFYKKNMFSLLGKKGY